MDFSVRQLSCCGLLEITGLNTAGKFYPKALVKELASQVRYNSHANGGPAMRIMGGRAAYILSYAYMVPENKSLYPTYFLERCDEITAELKAFIKENKFGRLKIFPDTGNPNYSNTHMIRMMIWTPNHNNIMDYCIEQKWAHAKIPDAYRQVL